MRTSQSPGGGGRRLQRGLCLATAGLAFSLGLVLGVLLPVLVFAENTWSQEATSEWTLAGVNPKLKLVTSNGIVDATPSWISQQEPPPPATRLRFHTTKGQTMTSTKNEGIFWSMDLEQTLPRGYGEEERHEWQTFVNRSVVVKVEEGCGRMQNRLVTFDDGVKSCCRYRQNNDQIQGEIFSYYLGRLLNIRNLPPSALAVIRGHEWQWDHVRSYLQLAQWNADRPVVLTQFLDRLVPAYIPPAFQNVSRRLHPEDLVDKTPSELIELAQWSDLIVFDYLTANLDRVVNNMYNQQWNADMMRNPAHNLAKSQTSGHLVFFDNESGLLHGYRLLDKYEHFHLSLLNSLCVFRYPTVRALERIHKENNVGDKLRELFEGSAMTDWLPFLPERYLKILNERIGHVYQHIQSCQKKFGSGSYRWRTNR